MACWETVSNQRIDLTAASAPRPLRLFCEEFINPKGIGSYFEAIWSAREACIAAL